MQTNQDVLESQKDLIDILKQKEMSLKNTGLGKESEKHTRKLEEVVEKWNKVYKMTNERKDMLLKQIESRESRQKTLNECVVKLNRTHEILSKDMKQCLSVNEVESIKQALIELECCDTTLKVLESQINSNENELSSERNNKEGITAIIFQCETMKTSLSNKLEKLETILKQEKEFNAEIDELLEWITSTKDALVVDFYSLSEDNRQKAAVRQETLAKEFSAKKETVEKLLRTGRELKSINVEKISENVADKMAELSQKWKGLEQIFATQEEHVEECLRQHQTYYDAVEQLWDWMQEIGKRMNIQMEKSEPNDEQELAEYLSMVREMKDKSLLFEKVLNSGEKLSAMLSEEEGGEIQEQLERLTSEWEMLKSQVVERSKELTEILGEDAWSKNCPGGEEMVEELTTLGVFEKRRNDTESGLGSSNVSGLSVEVSAEETELNYSENSQDVKKGTVQENELTRRSSAKLNAEETVPKLNQHSVDSAESCDLSTRKEQSQKTNDFAKYDSVAEHLAEETELDKASSSVQSKATEENNTQRNLVQISDFNIELGEEKNPKDISIPSLSISENLVEAEKCDVHRDTENDHMESTGIELKALRGLKTTQCVPEVTNQISEAFNPDNSVLVSIPGSTKTGKIDFHDSVLSNTDGAEEFVQILVLPTGNDGTTVDFPAEADRSDKDYAESFVKVSSDINSNDIESSAKHLKVENIEDSRDVLEYVPGESAPEQIELFLNQIKDSEDFLDGIETKVSQLNEREGAENIIQELLTEFSERDQEFENVLETGMGLVRDISEEEQFAVEEKIITVEERWKTIKDGLLKRKAAVKTSSMLENRFQEFAKYVEEISEFLSGKKANQEWLFTDEEAGSVIECYLGWLEREQVALKGLIEGTKDTLRNVPGKTSEQIKEKLSRVSKNQTELARQLNEKKTVLERWFEFCLILEGVQREVEALTLEFKDLVDGEETEIMMESHLSESRVHMLKILLGSLEGKANTLCELSKKYKDVLSSSDDCNQKYKTHERNIAEKMALVVNKLEKLENYLESFKELEVETNELQVEVRQADEALSTLGENLSSFDEVDSRVNTLERLSEIKHLQEDILRLEPRVKLVKEKSMEQLDNLDYENSGYWFQEDVQCLVSRYEKARTRAKENLESIEKRVSLKDQFEMKLLEITAFLVNVEEYLNEDEEIPSNFDVTAKEVALLNGRRFLKEMELKERNLRELMETSEKLSKVERKDSWKEEALQLRERFITRLKELRKNVSCLDETIKCFNDFEQKVEELASLMYEVQGFLYGEGVATKGLQDLLELGRSCLENVEHKEETLLELKNRVERLTESFKEEDKEVIIAELVDLEKKLASLEMNVVKRISSLEALEARRDKYKGELDEVRNGISSLEQEMKENNGENKAEVFSSLQNDKQPDESLSEQILDKMFLEKQPDENFSRKLEELRIRLENLNKMKIELKEESQETNVDLDNVLGLEPLELTFADLERINQEKTNELRKYEEQQKNISAKVVEFEEKFSELKTQYKENKVYPQIVLETAEEADILLQEVEDASVDVRSVTKFTEERAKMVKRLEAIRSECVEMQRRLVVDNTLQLGEECNNTSAHETSTPQGNNTESEAIGSVVVPTPFHVSNALTCNDAAYNVNVSESQLTNGLSVTDYKDTNILIQDKLDEKTHHPSSSSTPESKVQNDFEVLQCQVETLAYDEEILDIIISSSSVTSGSLVEELETAKAKLELVKQKENHLQIINSQAVAMWNGIPTKEQGIYEENVIEIKEKLATAEECLVTRIKMLEQCMQTREMLEENLLECYKILEAVEGEKYDPAMVMEYVEVLQDPNNCLQSACRLCFALNVVGDFEEAERVKEEIQDLRERWDMALEHVEQQVREVNELEVLKEDTPLVNGPNEEPVEATQLDGSMKSTLLSIGQQENIVDENAMESNQSPGVHGSNASSRENFSDDSEESDTLQLKQSEKFEVGNLEEEIPTATFMNGKNEERPENNIVAGESEPILLDCISDLPNEASPDECIVKEISIKDISMRNRIEKRHQNTEEENILEDRNEYAHESEPSSDDNIAVLDSDAPKNNTNSLKEQDNAVEINSPTLIHDNKYICVIQDEGSSTECIVKRIPYEDILVKNTVAAEKQRGNAAKDSMVEDHTSDVSENVAISTDTLDDIPNEINLERGVVKEIPEVIVVNRHFSENQPTYAVERHIVDDGSMDVFEKNGNLENGITIVPDNFALEKCDANQEPEEGILINGNTKTMEGQEKTVELADVYGENEAISAENVTHVPKEVRWDDFAVKEIPYENALTWSRTVSRKEQKNIFEGNIMDDRNSYVGENEVSKEERMEKERLKEGVEKRTLPEKQVRDAMEENVMEASAVDGHERKDISRENFTSISEKINGYDCTAKVINENIRKGTTSVEEQEIAVLDIVADQSLPPDDFPGVSEKSDSEKCLSEEVSFDGVLIKDEINSLQERNNAEQKDSLTASDDHKKDVISINAINDVADETHSEKCCVSETPEGDDLRKVEQQEKDEKENKAEDSYSDVHENEVSLPDNIEVFLENVVVKDLPEESVNESRKQSEDKQDNEVENDLANDGSLNNSDNEVSPSDNTHEMLLKNAIVSSKPEESVSGNKTVSESVRDHTEEENVADDALSDDHENEVSSPWLGNINKVSLEKGIVTDIAEGSESENRRVSQDQQGIVAEKNSADDRSLDIPGGEVSPPDNIIDSEVFIEKVIVKDTPEMSVNEVRRFAENKRGILLAENMADGRSSAVHEKEVSLENVIISSMPEKSVSKNSRGSEDLVEQNMADDRLLDAHVNEIPEENVNKNRRGSEDVVEENIASDGRLDAPDNEAGPPEHVDQSLLKKEIVRGMPEKNLEENRGLLADEQIGAVEKTIADDRSDIHENEVYTSDDPIALVDSICDNTEGFHSSKLPEEDILVHNKTLSGEYRDVNAEDNIAQVSSADEEEAAERNNLHDVKTQGRVLKREDAFMNAFKAGEQQDNLVEGNFETDGTSNSFHYQATLADEIWDISKDVPINQITSGVEQKEISCSEDLSAKPTSHTDDEVTLSKGEIVEEDNIMTQNNITGNQKEKPGTETGLSDHQTVVRFSLQDSAVPSFFLVSDDKTYKESKAVEIEDFYYMMNKLSNELVIIKNTDHTEKISPQKLLEYQVQSLRELRRIETRLQAVASEDINFDTVEKDKKNLLSNLVKEQQLEIAKVRDVLNNRVKKIKSFFEMKTRIKNKTAALGAILEEALNVEKDEFESKEFFSLEKRVKRMEDVLNTDVDLSEEFVSCLESLSSEYPSLNLSYAVQIHERYNVQKSKVATLLDVARKHEVQHAIEEELNNCWKWLSTNEQKINRVIIDTNADVGALEKSLEDVDIFLVGLEDNIQRFSAYSIPEEALLNILPKPERDALLSKVSNLEKHLTKTRAFVFKRKQDLKAKLDIARHKEKISTGQSWCEKAKELLNCSNKSSQCVLNELSDLVNEGELFIENVEYDEQFLNDNESCDVVDVAKEILQAAKERLQNLTEKEEKLQKLSYEISELERRTLVPFEQTKDIDNIESGKFEEVIQNAQHRLRKISKEIRSTYPDLETHPANSAENELLRKSEYLLKEIEELTEKRSSMETIADCGKCVEDVENVCNKPMVFSLDVVKMKKELAELGKISLELKDKEAKLQKVG